MLLILDIRVIITILRYIIQFIFAVMFMDASQYVWSNEPPDNDKQTIIADWQKQDALEQWKEKSFVRNSKYQIVLKEGELVLRADTASAASSLYKKNIVDLRETPFLQWRWKVKNTYQQINQRTKEQDDYPARVYVIYQHWLFPWQSKVLNYVWSNEQQLDEYWFSPYTNNSIMIPLRTAKEVDGQWYLQRVNIQQDFKRYFDLDINQIHGVAIMSDSDNTGLQAVAYYGRIWFSD